jgi:hypothetical protein
MNLPLCLQEFVGENTSEVVLKFLYHIFCEEKGYEKSEDDSKKQSSKIYEIFKKLAPERVKGIESLKSALQKILEAEKNLDKRERFWLYSGVWDMTAKFKSIGTAAGCALDELNQDLFKFASREAIAWTNTQLDFDFGTMDLSGVILSVDQAQQNLFSACMSCEVMIKFAFARTYKHIQAQHVLICLS